MGHIRLKQLPATRKWRHVVALLASGGSVEEVASASADAADAALQRARDDPTLAYCFWLLTQIPLAARAPDFAVAAGRLGLKIGAAPTLLEIASAFSDAIDRGAFGKAGRTDLGEIAHGAALASLTGVVGAELPTLFGETPGDVRAAIGRLAAPDQFQRLTRDFFARLTQRHLDYYLSRTIALNVGPGQRFPTVADQSAFDAALDLHCREAARIVEAFAGGWFSKTNYRGGITPQKARDFVFIALNKISAELRKREAAGA